MATPLPDGIYVIRTTEADYGDDHDGQIWSWRHAACGATSGTVDRCDYAWRREAQRLYDQHLATCGA